MTHNHRPPPENASLIDYARSACLCDVGQPDYAAVTAVRPDGTVVLVLADRGRIGDPTATVNATCPTAPHEQDGPLPDRWRDRVHLAPFYCGRRTLRGTRCRIPVAQPGQACGWHRPQPATDTDKRDERNTR